MSSSTRLSTNPTTWLGWLQPGSTQVEIDLALLPDGKVGPRRFKIKTVEPAGMVERLLKSRYGWRGYKAVRLPTDARVSEFSLAAVQDEVTIGSITVSFDGPDGLGVDAVFREEVDTLRRQGHRICQFVRVAVDPTVGTKRVLASLFHVAYIVAHRIRGYDTLLIEVNPRHVNYYRRMLGLRVLSSERLNLAVGAPAVLLGIDFAYVMQQIGEFGGHPERGSTARSLYPFAFSLAEEAAIIVRLNRKQAAFERVKARADLQAGSEADSLERANVLDWDARALRQSSERENAGTTSPAAILHAKPEIPLPVEWKDALPSHAIAQHSLGTRATVRLLDESQGGLSEKLPAWARDQIVTKSVRVLFEASIGSDVTAAAIHLIENSCNPLETSFLTQGALAIAEENISVLGVFPSGAVRTVGEAIRTGDHVKMRPFSFWDLIDPDDCGAEIHIGGVLRYEVELFGIELEP